LPFDHAHKTVSALLTIIYLGLETRRATKRREKIMATILAFQQRPAKLDTKQKSQHVLGKARVIIFSGVRYERLPEATITIVKPAKKTRKTA
jgi:hypothetical protein